MRLKMVLEGEPACRHIHAVFRYEDGTAVLQILERQGESDCFEGTFTLEKPGLCFYRFELEKEDGTYLFIGTTDGVHAAVGDWLPEWKLTVYGRDFKTPEALAGGIWYQIFPDRFYKKENVPAGEIRGKRIYHECWEERPLFTQDRPDFAGNDFFGGNLPGITEKLPYLKELGVDLLYLNPVFESGENHRYSTADYEKIDPLLGTNEDFEHLCKEAKKLGIRVVLDGVFSHTGANSRYFNKDGLYPDLGAYQSPDSPYYHWYDFKEFPDQYDCWWGFETLPCVKELSPDFMRYISGERGIAKYWMDKGAYGWRLDVADELPDGFLEAFRKRVKATDPDSIIIGEVWENAVEKVSYGTRRKFLLGDQCDTVMNYPWLNAILHLLKTKDTQRFYSQVMELMESYPPPALQCLMNILSTHDTPRFLNQLAVDNIPPRAAQADNYLSKSQRETALALMKKAAILQFTLPGIPCIFYGDEVGMEGYGDPYCRGTYPWGGGDQDLLAFYRKLGNLRLRFREAFKGDCVFRSCKGGKLVLERGSAIRLVMNFSDTPMETEGTPLLTEGTDGNTLLPGGFGWYQFSFTGRIF